VASYSFAMKRMSEMRIIEIMVPPTPKAKIRFRFRMKFFFLREYPAANMIGGRIKRKNPS
jgi:hypothetical protein